MTWVFKTLCNLQIAGRRKFRSQTSINFRQYGQMEKQIREKSEKRKEEERRSEKRKRQKTEDSGARKGKTVARHCVFSNVLWLWRVEK